MKKLRIYIDTSVIGGCFDPEFKIWYEALMEDFRQCRYVPVISDVTAAEIEPAPLDVKRLHLELLAMPAEEVSVTDDAISLVENYMTHSVLGHRFYNDMLHIAIATIVEVDVLVSWNFKHIVRLDKIRLFNAVNLEHQLVGVHISLKNYPMPMSINMCASFGLKILPSHLQSLLPCI